MPADDSQSADSVRTGLTVVAALLAMVGPFSIDTYLPSFPDIEREFGVGRSVLSQSLGVYLVAFGASSLFWGALSDRIGRRRVILAGLLLYTLASAGCATATNGSFFLISRALQGLSASGGFIGGRAMIRDAHDTVAAHRAMARVMLMFALAPAMAPVLGGWLHDNFGWRSVFIFLALFGGSLLFITAVLDETLPAAQRQSFRPIAVLKVYLATLRSREFVALVFALGFGFGGLFLYIAGAPTVIYDFLGWGADDFGWQFIPMVAGMVLGAFVSGRLARFWPVRRTIQSGLGLMVAAASINLASAVSGLTHPAAIIGPMVLYTIGIAMVMPAISVLAMDCFPDNRGAATSMQGFVQMLINAAVASLLVPLLQVGRNFFVTGQAALLLLAILFWIRYIRSFPMMPKGA